MAPNNSVNVDSGYTPYFSFATGFQPESNIASTSFSQVGAFNYRYVITFDDGSGVIFGFTNDEVTFTTNDDGHLILAAADTIAELNVYAPGTIPGGGPPPDPLLPAVVSLLADAAHSVDWVGSPFAPNFVETWLAGNNQIVGQAGTGPDNSILDDQHLFGHAGNDLIAGGGGDDTIVGGTGFDNVGGGAGSDTFVFEAGDFAAGENINGTWGFLADVAVGEINTIEARASIDFSTAVGIIKVNQIVFNGADTLTFRNNLGGIGATEGGGDGTGIMAGTEVVGDAGANALIITAAAGFLDIRTFTFSNWTAGADTLTINVTSTGLPRVFTPDTATTVNGFTERDSVTGGAGADTINGLDHNDTLSGGGANDRLNGGAGDDSLSGGAGNDLLNGSTGLDTMSGGTGNDLHIVHNAGDVLSEAANEGTDTVQSFITWTLGANFEHLQLLGTADLNATGNNLNNLLTGNSGANRLNGGGGIDTMVGGLGNDTYSTDNVGDVLSETGGGGIDTVIAAVTRTLGVDFEHMNLAGAADITANGNGLNNRLSGNAGNNTLNGGGGIDTMLGGLGNDTYRVDNVSDVTTETGAGVDTVISSVNRALGALFENLTLIGGAPVGFGNELDNVILGHAGANALFGRAGNDTVNGGGGADRFIFSTALDAATNVDVVQGFSVTDDFIGLDGLIFTGLGMALDASEFVNAAAAQDEADRIIYDGATGDLSFDADGTGGASSAIRFASLTAGLALSHLDFQIF